MSGGEQFLGTLGCAVVMAFLGWAFWYVVLR